MGCHARPTCKGILLTMRSRKQQLFIESSLAYPRGKEGKVETQKDEKNSKEDQTLGYLGVVKPITPEMCLWRALKFESPVIRLV
ncbi:hypothetical protein AVEN_13842-1 [Araneus ventricosus]|uniref:Uncharacterized protein n=1 Tax=Araneus ventricosus TaxID=182803 RepID=A0A4Y2LFA2_ARAVE|nr:hypothetical protein AVEN_13842-1 [Araneus ventricosus]